MTVRARNSRSWLTRRCRRAGRRRSAPAGPARPGRGRWWARRAGTRRSGDSSSDGQPGPGRLPAGERRSSGRPGRRRGRGRPRPPPARSSRSAPPRASQRSSASAYASSAPGSPAGERVPRRRPSRPAAAATPVRRAEERRHRLAGPPLGLLRQVADGGRRRAERRPCPASGASSPARMRSSVDLPGAVRPDQADDVAGRDHEVEAGEQDAVAVPGGKILGDQSCAHEVTRLLPPNGKPSAVIRRSGSGPAGDRFQRAGSHPPGRCASMSGCPDPRNTKLSTTSRSVPPRWGRRRSSRSHGTARAYGSRRAAWTG